MARLFGVEQDLGLIRLDQPSGRGPSLGGRTSTGGLGQALTSAGQIFSNLAGTSGQRNQRREGRFVERALERLARAGTGSEHKVELSKIRREAYRSLGSEGGAVAMRALESATAPEFDVDEQGIVTREKFTGERDELLKIQQPRIADNVVRQAIEFETIAPNANKAINSVTNKINAHRAKTGGPQFGAGTELGPILNIQDAAVNAFRGTERILISIKETAAIKGELRTNDNFRQRATEQILSNYYAAMNAFFDDDLIAALRDVENMNENDIALIAQAFASDFNQLLTDQDAFAILDIDMKAFTELRDQFTQSLRGAFDAVKGAEQRDQKFRLSMAAARLAYKEHLIEFELKQANNQFGLDAEKNRVDAISAIVQAMNSFDTLLAEPRLKDPSGGTPEARLKNTLERQRIILDRHLGALAGAKPSIKRIYKDAQIDLSMGGATAKDIVQRAEGLLVSHLENIFNVGDLIAVGAAIPALNKMINNLSGQALTALEIMQSRGDEKAKEFAERKSKVIQNLQLDYQKFVAKHFPDIESHINEIDSKVFNYVTTHEVFGTQELQPEFRGF